VGAVITYVPCRTHSLGAGIEGRCYLVNQMQQQPRGPQLWKEQVAGKQST
jgi:hypothetical protein